MFSQQMAQALLAGADVLKCVLHSHPEIEISFKFIPKILMSKECINFLGHSLYLLYLCMYILVHNKHSLFNMHSMNIKVLIDFFQEEFRCRYHPITKYC